LEIALIKRLAEALDVTPVPASETNNPLFTWAANWTKAWDNRRLDDMLVLVNNTTNFSCGYLSG